MITLDDERRSHEKERKEEGENPNSHGEKGGEREWRRGKGGTFGSQRLGKERKSPK